MEKYLKLLGKPVRDRITSFVGVVTSISFDLYGCVQAIVTPPMDKATGKQGDSHWFDTKRLEVTDENAVMEQPTFEIVPGGQSLPDFPSKPLR